MSFNILDKDNKLLVLNYKLNTKNIKLSPHCSIMIKPFRSNYYKYIAKIESNLYYL